MSGGHASYQSKCGAKPRLPAASPMQLTNPRNAWDAEQAYSCRRAAGREADRLFVAKGGSNFGTEPAIRLHYLE